MKKIKKVRHSKKENQNENKSYYFIALCKEKELININVLKIIPETELINLLGHLSNQLNHY